MRLTPKQTPARQHFNTVASNPGLPTSNLTEFAADLFDAPMAGIWLVGQDAEFKSQIDLSEAQGAQVVALCEIALQAHPGAVTFIPDLRKDHRRSVTLGASARDAVRFFAGAVLVNSSDQPLGVMCIADTKPHRKPTAKALAQLGRMANMAVLGLEFVEVHRNSEEITRRAQVAERIAGIGHWRYDVTTGQCAWSDHMYEIYGLRRDHPLDAGLLLAMLHPEDAEAATRDLADVIGTPGPPKNARVRILRPDGTLRHVITTIVPDQIEHGKAIALVGTTQDITERVQAEQAIADSEARYRLLAENSLDVVLHADVTGCITYVSPACTERTGYSPAELTGRCVYNMVHADDRSRVRAAVRAQLRSADAPSVRIEYRVRHRDGRLLWLEARPTRAVDAVSGEVTGYTDIVRDVTARREMEDQLRAALEEAHAAARAKSEFLANMSHELRTPLTSVIGFSSLLRASGQLGRQEKQFADRIHAASESLLAVINDILDFSKLETDAVELDPTPFDVRDLIKTAVELVETSAAGKGLALSATVAENMPEGLVADPGRLRQVLLNLMSNAVKFTASGSVSIAASWEADPHGRSHLHVAVTDTGIGIEQDQVVRLFERFTQADTSTTRLYGGTGLGLAISRRLIAIMGGEIGVTSTPGQGSTFWFRVPVTEATLPTSEGSNDELPAIRAARVLMADDVAANRELVTVVLTNLGLDVETVEDGAKALEAARHGAYDMVLMDIQMPVMDGFAAMRSIRALGPAFERLPILALTASVQPDDVARYRDAGFDECIGKPINFAELVGAMSHWLSAQNDQPFEAPGPAPSSANLAPSCSEMVRSSR